jgi:multiple antibiotic resistance protein
METLSAAVTLFLVLDPFGNVPFFLSVLKGVPEARRQRVVIRELLIAYVTLLLFLFGGRYFIEMIHLRTESISIAGGIILFLIALRMVFPIPKAQQADSIEGEPLLVPLAIPGVAGPSAMATVLLLMTTEPDRVVDWLVALTGAWLLTAIVLVSAPFLYRLLKERGLTAMERLMGMILVAVAVQMFLDGIAGYLASRA